MSWSIAAVGATLAALLESTVVPNLAVGGAHPHLVLVLGVVWTVAAGAERGLVWAFAGGLALDVFLHRPLGASAFALVVSLGAAAMLAGPLTRVRPLSPIPLVLLLSFVNSVLLLVLFNALSGPIQADPLQTLLPGVFYDTLLAALVGPLAISIRDRQLDSDRADW